MNHGHFKRDKRMKRRKEKKVERFVFDPVSKPRHYNLGKVECIDAIESAVEGLSGIEAHCTGTALKYLWRWKHKNGAEDLKKAKWYIDHLLKHLE